MPLDPSSLCDRYLAQELSANKTLPFPSKNKDKKNKNHGSEVYDEASISSLTCIFLPVMRKGERRRVVGKRWLDERRERSRLREHDAYSLLDATMAILPGSQGTLGCPEASQSLNVADSSSQRNHSPDFLSLHCTSRELVYACYQQSLYSAHFDPYSR